MKYLKEGVGGEGNECLTVVDVEQAPSLITRKQPGVVLRRLNVEKAPGQTWTTGLFRNAYSCQVIIMHVVLSFKTATGHKTRSW